MPTSGVYTLTFDRNEILKHAYALINIVPYNETLQDKYITYGQALLNLLLASWKIEQIQLWNRRTATLFLEDGKESYAIGPTGDRCVSSYEQTTTSVAAVSGATSITVTDATDIAISDVIGVHQDDGTVHWTTVTNKVGNVLTLNAPLTNDVEAINIVITYDPDDIIQRPVHILTAMYKTLTDNTEILLSDKGWEEYYTLPTRQQSGAPNQYHYSPTLENGTILVWPQPDNNNYVLSLTYKEPIEYFTTSSQTPDLPDEWYLALIFGLAELLCFPNGRYTEMKEGIGNKANMLKEYVKSFDADSGSLYPTFRKDI